MSIYLLKKIIIKFNNNNLRFSFFFFSFLFLIVMRVLMHCERIIINYQGEREKKKKKRFIQSGVRRRVYRWIN